MSVAILLSGGMDSVALTYWRRSAIDLAITINYGQKSAKKEIEVSALICKELNLRHEVIVVDCASLGIGDMSDHQPISLSPTSEWWPYRNQLLITLACMKIATTSIKTLLIGSVKSDSIYVDGSERFIRAISNLITMQEGEIQILAPAIALSTVELINTSKIPDKLLFWAHSCNISNTPCGICDGCKKYLNVIQSLNDIRDV